MFERLNDQPSARLQIWFEDQEIEARAGETVAAALLAAGIIGFRSTFGAGEPRGPYCMMGACFECLVEIGGETAQACMTPVGQHLRIRRLKDPAATDR